MFSFELMRDYPANEYLMRVQVTLEPSGLWTAEGWLRHKDDDEGVAISIPVELVCPPAQTAETAKGPWNEIARQCGYEIKWE
jgi:hypothetical protein